MKPSNTVIVSTEYIRKKEQQTQHLEQDREILKSFIVRHHPEMEGWIRKNFGKGNER